MLRTRKREGGRKGRKGRVRGKEGEREREEEIKCVCVYERGRKREREGEEERAGNETGGGNRSRDSALTRPRVSYDYVAM